MFAEFCSLLLYFKNFVLSLLVLVCDMLGYQIVLLHRRQQIVRLIDYIFISLGYTGLFVKATDRILR